MKKTQTSISQLTQRLEILLKQQLKSGSGQFLLKSKRDAVKAGTKPQPVEEENEIDGFGWTYRQTLTSTKGPVTIKITGKPNDEF